MLQCYDVSCDSMMFVLRWYKGCVDKIKKSYPNRLWLDSLFVSQYDEPSEMNGRSLCLYVFIYLATLFSGFPAMNALMLLKIMFINRSRASLVAQAI